jgi:sugar phosphate isomerase/epimerase
MQLGIFAKTFVRPDLGQTLDAIVEQGLRCTQFNLACAGLPSLPDQLDAQIASRIRREFAARQLAMSAVSGTYNMIHPDPLERQAGLRRLLDLIATARSLGTSTVTLCTGTRTAGDMWRHHPDNATLAAWRDLLAALEPALAAAQAQAVTLVVEPEPGNVVDGPVKARQLLDELRSPQLKIVIDAANLFHPGELPRMAEVLDAAFALLGPDIVLAHAKELRADGVAGGVGPGRGVLDWDGYIELLRACGYRGPLIIHGLSEPDVPASVAFLRARLARIGG